MIWSRSWILTLNFLVLTRLFDDIPGPRSDLSSEVEGKVEVQDNGYNGAKAAFTCHFNPISWFIFIG